MKDEGSIIMKKLLCIFLVLLLCFGICGCNKSLPSLDEDEKEIVNPERRGHIYGVITDKPYSDVLVVKLTTESSAEEFGEEVYVVTDDADEWCEDDEVTVWFTKYERPLDEDEPVRIIADAVNGPMYCAKPIIYFYPEEPTELSVKLSFNGKLTCTYPAHGENGWQNFTAYPNGTLIFPDGKEYYALYWEGIQNDDWDFSKGFCVRGEDTAEFLEWALKEQGLNAREANEFIVYWLPLMQDNAYNVISFQTDKYTENAVLTFSQEPDSLLRVFMAYYASEEAVELEPQTFEPFQRDGFTVVEWGGSKVK